MCTGQNISDWIKWKILRETSEILYYNYNYNRYVVSFNKSQKSYKKETKYEHLKKVLILRLQYLQISKYNINTAIYGKNTQKTWGKYHKINGQPNCKIIETMIDEADMFNFSPCMPLLLHLHYSRVFVIINAPILVTIARSIMTLNLYSEIFAMQLSAVYVWIRGLACGTI